MDITCILLSGFIVFVCIALPLFSYGSEYVVCKDKYSRYEPTYGIIKGCQVKIDGEYIPVENWRVIERN